MGYEYGDAQNIAVRVLLYQISKKHNFFDSYFKELTLKYFDYKCPYTGVNLTYENRPEMDHIIPANKNCCGLHIYGNVLIVSGKANSAKGNKSLEEFLKNEPEKLQKIQKFMQESGYLEIHQFYQPLLKEITNSLYDEIGQNIRKQLQSIEIEPITNSNKNIINKNWSKRTMSKDYTKYDLNIKDSNKCYTNISKSKLPMQVFKYLIENNLMTSEHFEFFSKNNFGRSWLSNMGDLIRENPNNSKRYTQFIAKGSTYYASNQWEVSSIERFNKYINETFGNHIKIEISPSSLQKRNVIDLDKLFL